MVDSTLTESLYRIETATIHNGVHVQRFTFPANSNNDAEKQLLSTCLSQTHKVCNQFFTARCKEEEKEAKEKESSEDNLEQQKIRGEAKAKLEDEENDDEVVEW